MRWLRSVVLRHPHVSMGPRLVAALAGAVLLSACGDTQAVEVQPPTATPTATAAPAGRVVRSAQEIDFTDPAVIGPLIDHFGVGQVEFRRIQFVDLTGDGRDEAFVVIESGGTAGDVGAALVGVVDGQPHVLGYVESGGRVELRFPHVGGGIVVATEGVWEPGDALCCPSSLRELTWEWRTEEFVLVDEQVVDNPDVD